MASPSSVPRLLQLAALALLVAPGVRAVAADAGAAPKAAAATPPAAAPKAMPKPAAKGKKAPKVTTVVLFHLNRKETLPLRLRDAQGKPVKGVQKRMNRFLRCHYTNKQHAMNPRLTSLLYQTGKHWPGRRIEVVSGYRNPTVAKNPRSPHMKGLACDFRVVGVKNTELRDYLRGIKKVGVGYYPNSSFVHLDVRKDRSAFWIDYSGPGERSVYSENAADDLKSGRAESYHPTKIDEDFINDAPPTRDGAGAGELGARAEANKPATPGVQGQTLAGQAAQAPQSATP